MKKLIVSLIALNDFDALPYGSKCSNQEYVCGEMLKPGICVWRRIRILLSLMFSLFLDLLAGFGYYPGRTLLWYLFVIGIFCILYSITGHIHLLPDALTFSIMSFHGRGFFPNLSGETNLHNSLVVGAAFEAIIGLFIEISFIATFTQRFFGR